MAAINIAPLRGAGYVARIGAFLRLSLCLRRGMLRGLGYESVVLEGRVYRVRAVPLGKARYLVPALIRCAQGFVESRFDDESLYDDLINVLALGLGVPSTKVEAMDIPIWDLAPVIDCIARVNGLAANEEAGKSDPGKFKFSRLLMVFTGTSFTQRSFHRPVGPGTTSTIH